MIRFSYKGEKWFDWHERDRFEWYGPRVVTFEKLLAEWARTWGPGAGWPRAAAADTLAKKFRLELEFSGIDANPPSIPEGAKP